MIVRIFAAGLTRSGLQCKMMIENKYKTLKGVKTVVKKTVSVFLAVCSVLCLLLPAAAVQDMGVISVKINSDIAGFTEDDTEKLIELKSANVVYSERGDGPVSISDYAGTPCDGAAVAGRTYYIDYMLTAADGFTLPAAVGEGDVEIECSKGVRVISSQIVTAKIRVGDSADFVEFRGLKIYAAVTVDSNAFQRVAGFIYDIILKIKAWSLY